MMTTKRWMLVLIAVTFVGAAAGTAGWEYATAPTPGVTLENYARLRQGMCIQQTHAILDAPDEEWGPDTRFWNTHFWKRNGLEVVLSFDKDGVLQYGDKRYQDAAGQVYIQAGFYGDKSILAKCREILGF